MPAALLKPPFPRLQRGRMLARGLVAAWPVYETSGNILHNISGISGLDGTLSNAPPWQGGRSGSCLGFNGSNQSANIANFSWPGGPVTVSLWAKAQTPAAGGSAFGLATVAPAGGRFQCHLPWSDNNLYWDYGYNGGGFGRISTSYGPYVGIWTHVGLVSDATSAKGMMIYLNGSAVVAGAAYGLTSGANLSLGVWSGSPYYYNGLLDDVRIYNRALSAAEIRELASGEA